MDVPGHERFVHTMLAGASGIDAALLVVALPEGVMPQTREHAQILELLGIDRGIVVLTKYDLAADRIDTVSAQVRALLADTGCECPDPAGLRRHRRRHERTDRCLKGAGTASTCRRRISAPRGGPRFHHVRRRPRRHRHAGRGPYRDR